MKRQPQATALTTLPFDQYSRQKLAYDLLDTLREKGKKLSILDVGGYKGVTHLFHAADDVTVLDVFDVTEKNYIKGDATAMEFKDKSFDFVVSFDVFEHIPRDKREAFVSECARVARKGVLIAAPVGTVQNAEAEVFLNDVFRSLHGKDHPWLIEHIDYRLPEPGLAQALLKKNGLHIFSFTSNYLPYWLLMQAAIFAASKFDKVGKVIDALYDTYNTTIYPDGTANPDENYRTVAFGLFSKADAHQIETYKHRFTIQTDKRFDNSLYVIKKVTQTFTAALDEFATEGREKDAELHEIHAALGKTQREAADRLGQLMGVEAELTAIKRSRAYRLAKKMADVKNYPKRAVKRGKQ